MGRPAIAALATACLFAILAPSTSAAPPGVAMRAGKLYSADAPLYVFAHDAAGQPACTGGCAAASPPFLAPADAKAEGLWTIVRTSDGKQQWAYAGEPLYTHSAPATGEPDPYIASMAMVRIKDVVAEGFAVPNDDPTVAARPFPGPRFGPNLGEYYPAASIRAGEQGVVAITTCVDSLGRPFDVKLTRSSGFPRLDEATLNALPRLRFTAARDGAGNPVGVCGFYFEFAWTTQ